MILHADKMANVLQSKEKRRKEEKKKKTKRVSFEVHISFQLDVLKWEHKKQCQSLFFSSEIYQSVSTKQRQKQCIIGPKKFCECITFNEGKFDEALKFEKLSNEKIGYG